jgi:multidrug efflux pump subunit AcrA (membrane-fusion protein)
MSERRSVVSLLVLLAALAAGCGERVEDAVPVTEVASESFEVGIRAHGELEASQATAMSVPTGLVGVQRIAWLADEGQTVREGSVVARLDGDLVKRQIRAAEDALEQVDYQIRAKERELDKERQSLSGQIDLLMTEKKDAEEFVPEDEELFSRVEMLEAEISLEMVETKIDLTEDRIERYTQRAEAELEIMQLQRQTEQVKLDQLRRSQEALEIKAPHDGLFLRARTWDGQPMRVGMTVWRSQQLGELPDTSRMEAKIWVLESEAAGLGPDLPADVILDAHPGRVFSGKVKSVQPVANPIEQESPVKYFEVVVALDETDVDVMRPGARVGATVWVERREGVITVPNQAVFFEGSENWVWIRDGAGFVKRIVELGTRSVSRTVVVKGLDAGDVVALVDPNEDRDA